MTAISTGVPEIILTDVTGSQVGTKSNPFFVSSSNPPQTVNVNNVNNVYIFNGSEFLASASYVLTSSSEYFPNAGVPRAAKPEITVTAQPTFTVKQPQAKPVVQPLVVDEQSRQPPPVKPKVAVEKPRPMSSSSLSLRERYARRVTSQETNDAEIDDELIAELARAYAMRKR